MSILSALEETQRDNNNLEDLAKLPQALIMQMAQNGQIPKDMVMPILGKKAEMAESTAKMNAAKQIAAQGGAQPTIMEQYMGQIAQAENPAPPMPEQQMQQPMPQQMPQQQMAQQPMPQGPEDVGIASQATAPMQMAGGGIIAFEGGGDIDDDEEDRYDRYKKKAQRSSDFSTISQMIGNLRDMPVSGYSENRGVGIKPDSRGAERGMEGKGNLESRLRAAIMQRESGGRDYDQKGNPLTSPKGAKYAMQVLDSTAKDPGFGIKPAKDISAPEYNRVGNEYIGALYNKYQDPKLTMIAYNYGPGATDKWLAAGADMNKLPKETQKYISGVNLAEGGKVKHYAGMDDSLVEAEEPTSAFERFFNQKDALKDYQDKLAKQKEFERVTKEQPGLFGKTTKAQRDKAASDLAAANQARSNIKQPAKVVPPTMPDELKNAQIASPANTLPQNPAGIISLKDDQKNQDFDILNYIKAREAKMDKAAEKDTALAGLAAGLGMLGGTSQYALENIGKGGQMGVQQLAQSQKMRAVQDKAIGELYGDASRVDLMQKTRQDALKERTREFNEKQGLASGDKLNKAIADARKAPQNATNMLMLNTLESKFANGKLDPSKIPELERLRNWNKSLEDNVRKNFTSVGGLGEMRLVGVK